MNRPFSVSATLFVLAAAPAPTLAQGRLWVVEAGSTCPQVDFTSIQAAVDAAVDGDAILVRAPVGGASYSGFAIDGKALRLVAEDLGGDGSLGKTQVPLGGDAEVRNLTADRSVTVQGFRWTAATLEVRDCAGPVWIEDCELDFGLAAIAQAPPTLEVHGSDAVAVVRTVVRGVNTTDSFFEQPTGDAGIGLVASDSTVHAYDSRFEGGDGRAMSGFVGSGESGAPGAVLQNGASLMAAGCDFLGGDGGDGGADVGSPGAGADALVLESASVSAYLVGADLLPGSGGACCFGSGVPSQGADGAEIGGSGSGGAQNLPGPGRSFEATSATVREGQTLTYRFDGEVGDVALLLVQFDQSHEFLPLFSGSLLLPQPVLALLAGGLDAAGSLEFGVPVPAGLVPAGVHVGVFAQGVFQSPTPAFLLGPGASVTLLDELHSPTDGC